jgi:hypothetical protein
MGNMLAIQFKKQLLGPSIYDGAASETSAAAGAIEVGRALADAEYDASAPGLCSQCRGPRNPNSSTAEFPNVFCSEQCEKEFVGSALASLSLEDCVRIQGRLEALLAGAEASAVEALSGGM